MDFLTKEYIQEHKKISISFSYFICKPEVVPSLKKLFCLFLLQLTTFSLSEQKIEENKQRKQLHKSHLKCQNRT